MRAFKYLVQTNYKSRENIFSDYNITIFSGSRVECIYTKLRNKDCARSPN